jgi:hypothetical protein
MPLISSPRMALSICKERGFDRKEGRSVGSVGRAYATFARSPTGFIVRHTEKSFGRKRLLCSSFLSFALRYSFEATGSPNRGGIASQLSAPGDFLGRRPLSLQFAIPSPGDLLQGTLPRPRSFLNCRRSSSRAVGPERGLFTGRKLGRLRSECQGIHRAEPGVCSDHFRCS